jgi:hypothetical protein
MAGDRALLLLLRRGAPLSSLPPLFGMSPHTRRISRGSRRRLARARAARPWAREDGRPLLCSRPRLAVSLVRADLRRLCSRPRMVVTLVCAGLRRLLERALVARSWLRGGWWAVSSPASGHRWRPAPSISHGQPSFPSSFPSWRPAPSVAHGRMPPWRKHDRGGPSSWYGGVGDGHKGPLIHGKKNPFLKNNKTRTSS